MAGLLAGKNIVVAVTGGIAAYKVGELVRLLIKDGAEVQVVMTLAAKAFVQPLTFQALTGRPVRDSLLDATAELGMGHIELGRWADLVIIAPASADAIARLSAGMANDLLTTIVLATRAPLAVVPAMNQLMWENPLTQHNLHRLVSKRTDTLVWGPASGDQACGDNGPGRMLEAIGICRLAVDFFSPQTLLKGVKVVLTAGPTREKIDPVRYISNESSGKMGYALAENAAQAGASVVLISGPVAINLKEFGLQKIKLVSVESAADMFKATLAEVTKGADIFIAAAAVADYRVDQTAPQKIKKSAKEISLRLVRNPDILASVAALDNPPFCVGFAAETQHVTEYAREKMQRKKIQMIIANDVSQADIGFNSDYNAVTVISGKRIENIAKMPKSRLAKWLIDKIGDAFNQHQSENRKS
jgi:phosphopantothenoylcysteine decarboxylase / phosphopantothenate---cysteine ligase